jgi:hypothetical protein
MPQVDIFIRSSRNLNPLRKALFDATRIRWEMDPLSKIHVICDWEILRARRMAEDFSKSDPYIFTDDDVLPMGKRFIERGREAMLAHPEFAVCSTLSLIEGENVSKGDGDIYEARCVGAPMWIRKGILTDLPDMDLNLECGKIDALVYAKGFKEGLFGNGLRHLHLGHGFSSNPQLHWAA